MKSMITTFILLALPMLATNANSEEIPSLSVDETLSVAMAEPLTVLWDECNMEPDSLGVLSCYRMLSDLSEQDYYYMDDREYAYYPVPKD